MEQTTQSMNAWRIEIRRFNKSVDKSNAIYKVIW